MRVKCIDLIIVVICLFAIVVDGKNFTPEQIRLVYSGSDMSEMVVSWVTGSSASSDPGFNGVPKSTCRFGTTKAALSTTVQGTSHFFDEGKYYTSTIHECILRGLTSGKKYYYQVGDSSVEKGLSEVYSFTAGAAKRWAIFGDYGFGNRERSYSALLADAFKEYDAVMHVGDIAYDLHNFKGMRGDEFLNVMQPLSANMPYLTTVGNHEKFNNFTHYINRFSTLMHAGRSSGSDTTLWYSFNQPNVHYIIFNTEVYAYFRDEGQIARQLKWMEQDLKKYNTPEMRKKYPWIISLAHKCDWQDEVEFNDFRDLLHKYGVDLHICGHQHNYQRLYPGLRKNIQNYPNPNVFVDPQYWTQIVVGSPGCHEKISSGLAPFKGSVAKYFLSYGYGILEVINGTHVSWKWKQTNAATSENGATYTDQLMISMQEQDGNDWKDHMMLIQSNHGPRV